MQHELLLSQAMTQMHHSCSKIWKNLSTQRDIQKALIKVFKSLNGLAPEYLSSKFIA